MTTHTIFSRRPRWARCATTLTGLLVLPALAVGCADQEPSSSGSDGDSSDAAGAGDSGGAPAVDPACPAGLTADQLGQSVTYDPADVDGDGTDDTIAIGTVDDGGSGCTAALVVTTEEGTSAVALPGLELVPPNAFVPGGAATVAGQSVIAAPVSWSPRGGGEVGLFTLVDGALVPVENDNGKPWTIIATIDDGGGVPQSIGCGNGGLTWSTSSSDGLGGPVHIKTTHYTLDGATLTADGQSAATYTERGDAMGKPGLTIFTDC